MSLPTVEPIYYELYREVAVGSALLETLDELVNSEHLPGHIAAKIMRTFDKIIAETLASEVKAKISFKGKQLIRYSGVDEIWWFVIEDVDIKFRDAKQGDPKNLHVDKLKVIACNGSSNASGRQEEMG